MIRFEKLHRESGWAGTSEDFGTSSALLFGDLLLAFSDELFSNGIAAEVNRTAVRASRIESLMHVLQLMRTGMPH